MDDNTGDVTADVFFPVSRQVTLIGTGATLSDASYSATVQAALENAVGSSLPLAVGTDFAPIRIVADGFVGVEAKGGIKELYR